MLWTCVTIQQSRSFLVSILPAYLCTTSAECSDCALSMLEALGKEGAPAPVSARPQCQEDIAENCQWYISSPHSSKAFRGGGQGRGRAEWGKGRIRHRRGQRWWQPLLPYHPTGQAASQGSPQLHLLNSGEPRRRIATGCRLNWGNLWWCSYALKIQQWWFRCSWNHRIELPDTLTPL